ncbi:interleukin-18 receptor accessory protein-like isoform X2 [Sander lucioperca]|uniref:interleukin-18 receptor accessory protein-like isoform X2 n=1 Tax=Sander lucioperca TaxID=283035 RepID=UPI00125D4646|nr:interleukin-18 receptor accessory protein-like isoform X2 [Sander lucioperca]
MTEMNKQCLSVYILCSFIFPIFLEGCCEGNQKLKTVENQRGTFPQNYRAVEGEDFMIPCETVNQHMVSCSMTGEGNEGISFVCGRVFRAEAKHSGEYTCSGSKMFFQLQVVNRSLGCLQSNESHKSVRLTVDKGGPISCPGHNCSNNPEIIWYKHNKTVSRRSCQKPGQLFFCYVRKEDTGVYFCDRQIIEQGVTWTFRRAVHVTVIPPKSNDPPSIIYPYGNMKEEVELGRSHTLMCKARFLFEIDVSPEVRWYMNYGGKMENMTLLPMEFSENRVTFPVLEVIRRAIIKEVTPQLLNQNHTYTCIANNTHGNSNATIKLIEKIKVKWPSLVGYPVVSLLLVAGLGMVLHVKWLEIQLIYRSHFQHGKHDGDKKEFDVLLSYVWSPPTAEVEGVLTSHKGPDTDEEACLSSMDPLNTEEGNSTQRPLEVLLPHVLEDRWAYRLCLLERDVLPGGAYANDVILAMQRSRMLICLLSADYLSNSNAVFVLESGIQALLQNSSLKVLLIWTSRASASLIQSDPPLPTLVQRALKVLPSLDWTSGDPTRATSNFWRSLRKAMPDQRVKLVSLMQDQ